MQRGCVSTRPTSVKIARERPARSAMEVNSAGPLSGVCASAADSASAAAQVAIETATADRNVIALPRLQHPALQARRRGFCSTRLPGAMQHAVLHGVMLR